MVLNVSDNDSHGFSSTMLAITHYTYNAITFFRCRWLITAALFIWLSACRANIDSTTVGGIYKTIRHMRILSSQHIASRCQPKKLYHTPKTARGKITIENSSDILLLF